MASAASAPLISRPIALRTAASQRLEQAAEITEKQLALHARRKAVDKVTNGLWLLG